MTSTSLAVAAPRLPVPEPRSDRRCLAAARSRHSSCVSQDRDGVQQIQSQPPGRSLQYRMISEMHKPRYRFLTDWASTIAGYLSAYGSAYTAVYTNTKEVSGW